LLAAVFLSFSAGSLIAPAVAQTGGNSTSVVGVVTDPSGAVIPGAKVEIRNAVSGFQNSATTDANGHFAVSNVPYNTYHLTVTAQGFASHVQDVDVRSVVPITLNLTLDVGTSAEVVTVESAGDLVETDPTFHTDVDKKLFDKLPLESQSSSLSSL